MMALQAMGWLLLLMVSVQLLGRGISQRLAPMPPSVADGFVHAVVGLAALILLVHLLLIIDGFYLWSVLLVMWLPLIWLRPALTMPNLQQCLDFIRRHGLFMLLVLLHFIPDALLLFRPESQHDALSYHLPYARLMADQHGLLVNEYLRYPLNVFNINLLFSVGMLLDGEILARAINTWMTLLLNVGVYVLCLSHFNKLTALLASWGLMTIDMLAALMVAAYVDVGVALWVFATGLLLLRHWREACQTALWLSAVTFGMALGSKYLVLMLLPMYLMFLWLLKPGPKRFWQILGVSVLIGGCWYLRNLWIAGNPVHPFAQPWFGFWLWTPADLLAQQADLLAVHGVSRSLDQLLQLPWLFHQGVYSKHGAVNLMLVLGLALLPLGLFFKGAIRWISVFGLFNVVLWFYTSQIARYLMFLFPWLVVLTAFMVSQLLVMVSKPLNIRLSERLTPWLTASVLVLLIAGGLKTTAYFNKLHSLQRIATDQQSWQQMQDQDLVHQLVSVANQQARLGTFVLSATATQHHFTGHFRGDWYGPANMRGFVSQLTSGATPQSLMEQHQSDLILVSKHVKQFAQPLKALNGTVLEVVADNDFGVLYRFKAIDRVPINE